MSPLIRLSMRNFFATLTGTLLVFWTILRDFEEAFLVTDSATEAVFFVRFANLPII